MNRRAALRLGGAALASGFAPACAPRRPPSLAAAPTRRFAPLQCSPDRVTRTLVGLRPFRPSGFVVRSEQLGSKLLVHNYGHGGGGITLSWGTAMLAVEQAERARTSRFAVLGSGAVGLATARLLQKKGAEVTIYARELPPETTSNIAGGQWSPVSVADDERRTPAFDEQFDRAARFAYRWYQTLLGPGYGVRWIENYFLSDDPPYRSWERERLPDLYPAARDLAPGEHPFPTRYARRVVTMLIEPHVYLAALTRDFLLQGGRIVVRDFVSRDQLLELPEPVLMNCTGLGSRALFGDSELVPVKGQLTVLLPQPEVDYALLGPPGLYMFPRSDGILLGGTFERGVESLEPDPRQTERMVGGYARLFASLR